MSDFILEAYVSNLGKYTEGRPAGEWVRFPTTPEQMKEVFDRIGIDGRNYEEWHITEYRSELPGLVERLNEYAHLDEINYLCALLSGMGEADREKFAAAMTHGEYAGNLQDLINLTQNLDCYELYPSVKSEEEYGYFLIDELHTMQLPEEAKHYFDFEAYGSDTIINEGGDLTAQGYIYNNRSPFTEHYNGRELPPQYKVVPEPAPPAPEQEKDDFEAAAIPQPRPVVPIIPTSGDPAEKLKEVTARLEQGIAEMFDSSRYTDYLRVMSKFPQYSLRNTLLIAMQAPDATHVMGFDAWKDPAIGRYVKANEKGIRIIAPKTAKKNVKKLDPDTGKPVLDKDGKPVTEEIEVIIPKFRVVCVYDVAQTEGKELPTLTNELTGNVKQYKDFFAALKRTSPFALDFEPLGSGAKGRCFYDERRIAILTGMSELQNVKTAIHEIAHATLHDTGSGILSEGANGRPDKRTREIQAESIAYAVCQHYGLDTSDYSFGYISGWSSGRELTELQSSLEVIRSTAEKLIETIDGHFAAIQQEKAAAQEQEEAQTAPQEPETPVFDKLTPEKQQELSNTIVATLQTLIGADMAAHGEVTAGTLEAIAAQGYSYRDGQLEKAAQEQPADNPQEQEAKQPDANLTDLQKKAVEIAGRYENLSMQDKIGIIAQAFGCTAGTIETSPCSGKWRGTSDISIKFDNGASLFIGNHSTPKAKTAKVQHEYINRALVQFNPEIISAAKEAAAAALMKREARDNEIAAQKELKPYTLLNVEFNNGADEKNGGYMGWYYVTIAVDGKIRAHMETGLNHDIADGKVSETLTRENYYAAGALKDTDVDYIFNNVGFSSASGLYSLPISDEVRERAEKTLAEREAAQPADKPQEQEAAQTTAAPYYSINEAAAKHAQTMNSFYDYKPGSATAEYRSYIDEAVQIAERQKKRVDPMYHDKIDSLLDTYARKLAANLNAHYAIEARVPSILIAGGSNFPVRKKEKQNAARDRNMEEWNEIQGLLDKIRSTGMGGISADDPQAVSKLESKLAGLEKLQTTMKAVNAYYRKHKTLDGCPDVSPEQGKKLVADMASYDRSPYPAWALSNNNAEIRRVKERIKSLSSQKEIGFVGWEFDGGKVEANTADNRLQIFFDGKPDADIRAELKSNGFKWSPKAEAWQRQLTDNAYYAANYIKAIQPLTGEKPTDLLRAHIRAQKEKAQGQPAQQEKTTAPEYIYQVHTNPRSDSRDNLCFLQAYLPQGNGRAKIGDVLYIGTPEKCRELMGKLKTGELTQGQVKELYAKAQEAVQPPEQGGDTFTIYQLKGGDETRDFRFEPYDRLQAAGLTVQQANYTEVYSAELTPGTSLEDIFTRFNIDHPKDFTGHSLSVSDVIVLHQGGQHTAHYVDSVGFREVPEFLQAQEPQLTPDERMTGEQIRTPRGSFYVTDMSREQMEAAGYGFHHQSDDGKYLIMGNGTRAFAIAAEPPQRGNPLQAAELSTEQNANMIDGVINNTPPTPTAAELEAKARAGEQISLADYAAAIKADEERGKAAPKGKEEKPSIRAQLRAAKEQQAGKKKTAVKSKNQDLEV